MTIVAVGTYFTAPIYRADATVLVQGLDPAADLARFVVAERAFGADGSSAPGTGAEGANGASSTTPSDAPLPLGGSIDERRRTALNHLAALTSRPMLERLVEVAEMESWSEHSDRSHDELLTHLDTALVVSPRETADLVDVSLEGMDPDRIAGALNQLLDLFAAAMREKQQTPGDDEITRREARIRRQLETVGQSIRDLSRERGGRGREQDLADIEDELRALRVSFFEARDALQLLERKRESIAEAVKSGESLDVRLGMLGDQGALERLRRLRNEHDKLQREEARILSRGGYRQSDLDAVRTRLTETDQTMQGLEASALALLGRRIAEASAVSAEREKRYEEMRGRARSYRDRVDAFERLLARRAELQRELSGVRTEKADAWLARSTQAGQVLVEVVDPALVPTSPIHPRPLRNLAAAVLAGLLGGLLLIGLLELLDDSIKGSRDVRQALRLPPLGFIPQLGGRHASDRMKLITVEQPGSAVSEAFRGICSGMGSLHSVSGGGVSGGGGGGNGRSGGVPMPAGGRRTGRSSESDSGGGLRAVRGDGVVLVTSAGRGEGKTTTAANLAVSLAQSGHRTLLVDANLRDPRIHRIFHVENERGLSSLVSAGEAVDRCVCDSGVPHLSVLPSGPTPVNPSEVFQEEELGTAFDSLRKGFDRIVIDAPSIGSGPDVVALGRLADSTLMVVGAYQTSRERAVAGKEYLIGLGVRVGGVILNRLRPGRGEILDEAMRSSMLEGQQQQA